MIYGTGITRPKRGESLVISHGSALEAYRRARICGRERTLLEDLYPDTMFLRLSADELASDESLRPLTLPTNTKDVANLASSLLGCGPRIDVIVGKAQSRRSSLCAACHVWSGPVSDGLISCLAPGVYLSGPELLFAQMAGCLSRPRLLELAYELCGTYSIHPTGSECEFGVRPLTSPERLQAMVRACAGVWGVSHARWAASRVLAGSNSPMESKLAILLSLGREEGGWDCGKPLLNHHIDLSEEARSHCGRSYLVADLFFEGAKTDVEYHGKRWHTRLANKMSDDARSNALDMVGVNCNVVWGEQLYDEEKMDGLASLLRKRSGLRPHRTSETPAMRFARSSLLEELRGSPWKD